MSSVGSRNWTRLSLDSLIEVASGQVDPKTDPYRSMIHVGGDNIEAHTGRLERMKTAGELGLISGKYEFGPEHVLYSKIRPALNKVALPEFSGICSADIYPIRPKSGMLTRRYLAHLLRSSEFLIYAEKHSTRTNIPKINREALLAFEAPAPPIQEQERIAAILDKADGIRRKRREAIALTEDLLRSTFLEMFGDPVTNPKGWPEEPLSSVVQEGTIVTYGIVQAGPPVEEGVPYIRTGDIQGGRILVSRLMRTSREIAAKYRRSEVRAGDLVISIRATVGTIAVVPDELDGANLTQGTARIAPGSRASGPYLLSLIRAPGMQSWIQKNVKGATFKEITLGVLRTAPIMLPPVELQNRFAAIAQRINGLLIKADAFRVAADQAFDSLVHRAFRGEL